MNLWEASLSGSVLILTACLIRLLWGRRLPPWTMPVLWWLALVRLLCPVSLPSPVGILAPAEVDGAVSPLPQTFSAPLPPSSQAASLPLSSLLGGLRLEYDGKLIDGSVRTQLRRMQESLNALLVS